MLRMHAMTDVVGVLCFSVQRSTLKIFRVYTFVNILYSFSYFFGVDVISGGNPLMILVDSTLT